MKKSITILALCLTCMAFLTGCGGKKADKSVSVDTKKLCESLTETISGDLNTVNDDLIASTYFIDMEKVEESAAALNSGASACEVAVIKCKNAAYTSEVEELFKNRIKTQSDLFADYNAPEVAKLESAILSKTGNYVVFCVTDDHDAAEKLVKEAGF